MSPCPFYIKYKRSTEYPANDVVRIYSIYVYYAQKKTLIQYHIVPFAMLIITLSSKLLMMNHILVPLNFQYQSFSFEMLTI